MFFRYLCQSRPCLLRKPPWDRQLLSVPSDKHVRWCSCTFFCSGESRAPPTQLHHPIWIACSRLPQLRTGLHSEEWAPAPHPQQSWTSDRAAPHGCEAGFGSVCALEIGEDPRRHATTGLADALQTSGGGGRWDEEVDSWGELRWGEDMRAPIPQRFQLCGAFNGSQHLLHELIGRCLSMRPGSVYMATLFMSSLVSNHDDVGLCRGILL